MDGAAISGIKAAGGIVFGMDFDVFGRYLRLFTGGKNCVGTIGIGSQREIFQYSIAVIGQNNSILAGEIAGVGTGTVAGFRKLAVGEGKTAALADEQDIFIGAGAGKVLSDKVQAAAVNGFDGG